MCQLGIEQRDDLTPRAESAGLLVESVLASEFGNKPTRNELADLREDRNPRFGWFINHQADPRWDRPPATSLFYLSCGMAVELFH